MRRGFVPYPSVANRGMSMQLVQTSYFDRYHCTVNYLLEHPTRAGAGSSRQARVALLIPCLNEERTIGKVIDDFRAQLPNADIVVIDNCCTDRTATVAAERGALVGREAREG